jgi:predicted phage terminase large subunit-like protein
MPRRRSSQDLAARVRGAADGLRRALDFGEWCEEVSPTMAWHWPHLRLIRAVLARMDPRAAELDGTLEPLAEFPDVVIPRQFRRLRLSVPPQHGKSHQVTIRWPAWLLERDPSLRVMVGAYSAQLAERFSRSTRRLLSGRVALSAERNAASDWETAVEPGREPGGLRALGVGGGATGNPADVLMIDDPVKSRAEAESLAYRERVWGWYTDDLYTRLAETACVVLIMTRWHHDDLAGRIANSEAGPDWVTLNLPAEAEDDGPDPLGRAPGEPLCPERFSAAALADKRRTLQSSYIALYQGRPTRPEGALVHLGWFRRYALPPLRVLRTVQSWDCATSDDPSADWSVGGTWAETDRGAYLVDVFRERLTYPGLRRAVVREAARHGADVVLIEDASHGRAIIQELTAPRSERIEELRAWNTPIIGVHPVQSKIVRMSVQSARVEAGDVWLPERDLAGYAWLPDYEQELVEFPSSANDDQVDMTSQYLAWRSGIDARRAAYEWAVVPGV